MSDFNFGIRIGAENDTKSGISGALSGLRSFTQAIAKPITIPIKIGTAGLKAARGSLALIRDLRLGLGGLVGKVDELIDAGLKFAPQLKSFESLTGKSGKTALDLAKSLVAASNGTLTLSRAIQIANRGMASGLGIGQLGTVLDFISKKAVTTGKDASAAIDTVVTGLARGSTLFLDDFGILVDGIEGVKRTFDNIKGVGAFDALGPAAQKAEIINQALGEMRQQMAKIGVTGKESYFVWESIKNSIRSSNEQLLAAVASSGSLRTVLESVQSVVKGITSHFEKGGGFGELLFGKKGGKGRGLLGLSGAIMVDLGVFIGKGFVGVVLKSIPTMLSVIPKLMRFAQDMIPVIKQAFVESANEISAAIRGSIPDSLATKWLHGAGKIGGVNSARDVGNVASDFWFGVKDAFGKLFGSTSGQTPGQQMGMVPSTTMQGMLTQLAVSSAMSNVQPAWNSNGPIKQIADDMRLTQRAIDLGLRNLGTVATATMDASPLGVAPGVSRTIGDAIKKANPITNAERSIRKVAEWVGKVTNPLSDLIFGKDDGDQPAIKIALSNQARIATILEHQTGQRSKVEAPGESKSNTMMDRAIRVFEDWAQSQFVSDINKAADKLLDSSVGFENTRKEFERFKFDFPGQNAKKAAVPKPKPVFGDVNIPLRPGVVRDRRRQMRNIEREIAMIEKGHRGSEQEARRRAAARIAKLRESGETVSRRDVQRILSEEMLSTRRAARLRAAKRIRDLKQQGRDVRPSDIRRIRQEEFDKLVKERTESLRKRQTDIGKSLKQDAIDREFRNKRFRRDIDADGNPTWSGLVRHMKEIVKEARDQTAKFSEFSGYAAVASTALNAVAKQLTGYQHRLQKARL